MGGQAYYYKYIASAMQSSGPTETICHAKKASSIQYGYRKYGARVRVFFQTLEDGNNKKEIRYRKTQIKKASRGE